MKIEFKISLTISRSNETEEKPFLLTRESFRRLRDQVRRRDNSTCHICGEYVVNGHVDHIIPLSRGGSDCLNNLAWSCPTCNREKGNKTPESSPKEIMPPDELKAVAKAILDGCEFSRRAIGDEKGLTTQPRYNDLAIEMERRGMINRAGNFRTVNTHGIDFFESLTHLPQVDQ